jgi:hypothetical protein
VSPNPTSILQMGPFFDVHVSPNSTSILQMGLLMLVHIAQITFIKQIILDIHINKGIHGFLLRLRLGCFVLIGWDDLPSSSSFHAYVDCITSTFSLFTLR